MMPEYIRVKDLSKTYRRHEAVKHISFQVNKGQIFAFLGPNGAGKSTTINILSTLLLKSSGIVRVGGLDLDRQRQAVKQKIGIVFQDDVLDEGLSVYQNLLYRGGLYLSQENVLKQRISELSSLLMLEPILTRKYGDCSGGQKRLAQIARALLPAPGLLILDEPTTGLDPVTRQKVWETLLVLREKLQMTIFLPHIIWRKPPIPMRSAFSTTVRFYCAIRLTISEKHRWTAKNSWISTLFTSTF